MRYAFFEYSGVELDLYELCGRPSEPIDVTVFVPRGMWPGPIRLNGMHKMVATTLHLDGDIGVAGPRVASGGGDSQMVWIKPPRRVPQG